MNKRHYEHTLPNIRGSLSNTYLLPYRVNAMNGLSSRIIIAFCHCRCRFMDKLME